MPSSTGCKVGKWLLGEVPRHDYPTESVLKEAARGWYEDRYSGMNVNLGLRWLKTHGYAEKRKEIEEIGGGWRRVIVWRLTSDGEAKLAQGHQSRSIPEAAPL